MVGAIATIQRQSTDLAKHGYNGKFYVVRLSFHDINFVDPDRKDQIQLHVGEILEQLSSEAWKVASHETETYYMFKLKSNKNMKSIYHLLKKYSCYVTVLPGTLNYVNFTKLYQ